MQFVMTKSDALFKLRVIKDVPFAKRIIDSHLARFDMQTGYDNDKPDFTLRWAIRIVRDWPDD